MGRACSRELGTERGDGGQWGRRGAAARVRGSRAKDKVGVGRCGAVGSWVKAELRGLWGGSVF